MAGAAPPILEHLHETNVSLPDAADRPSIYETLATEELRDLVQPAFRYVLVVCYLNWSYAFDKVVAC